MNRRVIIYSLAAAFIVFLSILLIIDLRQPPAWQASLNHYLAFLHAQGEPAYHLSAAVQAVRPEGFTASMISGSYTSGATFLVDYTTTGVTSGLEPITFPPKIVWCALLNHNSQQRLVYVSMHYSQAGSVWIVHESPDTWGSTTLDTTLATIGCSFQ